MTSDAEKQRDYRRRKQATDPDYNRREMARLHKWQAENPQKQKIKKNRIKRGRRVKDSLRKYEWDIILDVFGHSCAYCDATSVTLEKDHVVPFSAGGHLEMGNVVPACPDCNGHSESGKGTKDMRTWLQDEQRYEAIMMSVGDAEYLVQEVT